MNNHIDIVGRGRGQGRQDAEQHVASPTTSASATSRPAARCACTAARSTSSARPSRPESAARLGLLSSATDAEVEAVRLGGLARPLRAAHPRAAPRSPPGRADRQPRLEHRPDQHAHHVPHEGVGLDPELEHVARSAPFGPQHVALEAHVVGPGRREGGEVVRARRAAAAHASQRLLVQRMRPPQRAVALERARRGARQHAGSSRSASARRGARRSRPAACSAPTTATSRGSTPFSERSSRPRLGSVAPRRRSSPPGPTRARPRRCARRPTASGAEPEHRARAHPRASPRPSAARAARPTRETRPRRTRA